MTIKRKRIWIPVVSCLTIACLIELLMGLTDIFGEDVILWDTLFRTTALLPILFHFYNEDTELRGKTKLKMAEGAALFASGAVLSALARVLISVFGVSGYEAASRSLMTGNIPLELIVLLAASPLLEEFFFRGVLYERLKEHISVRSAMVVSALFFGLYHGNISQGIYGFFMGIFLAWSMERCRTVAAPLLIHIAANAAALFLELVNFL